MPWLVRELSIRVLDRGGPVRDGVLERDLPDEEYGTVLEPGLWKRVASLQGNTRILLFIHGYNNDLTSARTSYKAFAGNMDRALAFPSLIGPAVGLFYWPGDARWLSGMSYCIQIQPAKDSASKLAAWIKGLRGTGGTPVEIEIVAHSLGCRLMLEVLDILRLDPNPSYRIRAITLMAAAVEEQAVDIRGWNPGPLRSAALLPRKRLLFFSEADRALYFWFPIGQFLAGEGFRPTAVGSYGGPQSLPAQRDEYYGANHGDYWPGEESALRTAFFLNLGGGIPSIPRRKIAKWNLPEEYELARYD